MEYKGWLVYLLLVSIVESNNWPEYNGPTSVSLSEGEDIGAEVFAFSVFDLDQNPLTVTIDNNKQFNLLMRERDNYTVLLKDTLDREMISRYDLQITINDGTISEGVTVRVRVLDVNDVIPVITNTLLSASIRENQPPGTFIINITVEDPDMGYNGAIEVFLDDPTMPFYLGDASTKQPVEHSYGHATVLLNQTLDYEFRFLYLVPVTVTDVAGCVSSCQEPLSTTQILRVNVLDEQDKPPYFTALPYVTSTNENMPIGSPIIQIVALDGDTSSPRGIEYYFVNSDNELVGQLDYFAINPSNGQISNTEIINTDSEEVKSHGSVYTLTVMAKEIIGDGEVERPALDRSMTTVSISLLDLNDEQPSFSPLTVTASVAEGLPVGSAVHFNSTVKVVDRDQGLNGIFNLRALDENDDVSPWFSVLPQRVVNEAVISLTTKQIIDFELNPVLVVKIEATDEQSGLTSYATITVSVEDRNDNEPMFSSPIYEAAVAERSESGTVVALSSAIVATDVDSGVYGDIIYSIDSNQDVFAIDSETAQVTVACDQCIDRESEPVYYLTVVAIDGDGLSDSAQLTITVTDINDNAPQFTAAVYEGTINESSTHFNPPVIVQATDDDTDANGQVSYTLLNYTNHFDIHPNGTVYVTNAVDAEIIAETIEIMVVAKDSGLPRLQSTAILRLHIVDINDEKPVFIQPAPVTNVSENANIGTVVYTVYATDNDRSPPNNDVTYSMLSGSFGQFTIEPKTGKIKVSAALDKESPRNEYSLVVVAFDGGQPAENSQQTVVIKITDVNDEVPVFLKSKYAFSIHEGLDVNVPVGTVQATDPDLNKQISYSITETRGYDSIGDDVHLANVPFSISQTTGLIVVSSTLDREIVSRVDLIVAAQDLNGLQQQISTVVVEIDILDVNDNPPVIEAVGVLEVDEGTYNNSNSVLLTQLSVTDDDESTQLVFAITTNPSEVYSVNSAGEVRLVKSVDRETVGKWMNFTVEVRDDVNNGLSSSRDVAVLVKDINDEKPQFREFTASFTIPESVVRGYELGRVQAVDRDAEPVNRQIEYNIVSGSLDKVAINKTTGYVTVTAEDLDTDNHQIPNNRLSLVIQACDTGVPRLCESRTMIITVMDVNDNAPTFSQQIYPASISEAAAAGETVLMAEAQIEAIDIDASPNGQNVKYSCCRPGNDTNQLFAINDDGQVIVASADGLRGHTGVYKLTVNATDWGSPSRTGSADVIVTVVDYNYNQPILSVYNDAGQIVHRPENSSRGDAIISIQASDADAGDNAIVDLAFVTGDPELNDYTYFYFERDGNLKNNRFTIRQNKGFDRENVTQYKFGLKGTDRGLPQLTSEKIVITVNVDDVNDNRPYFPDDKQSVRVSVQEEQVGVTIGSIDFAQDKDDREVFCYIIVGARTSEESTLPAHESVIKRLFTVDSITGHIRVAEGQKLDRETQSIYILVIKADDRDDNVYNNCERPLAVPWVSRRTHSYEMELHITVEDIDDNSPIFSQRLYMLAAVRGVAASTTLIKLENFVSDPDESQQFEFSRGEEFSYMPSSLGSMIKAPEPVTVFVNGEIKTEITFTNDMQGSLTFGAVARDPAGHSSEARILIYIIDNINVAILTVSKDAETVEATINELEAMFLEHARWNISIISVKENPSKSYHTDIELFVVPNPAESLQSSHNIFSVMASNPTLLTDLYRYGYLEAPQTQPTTDEEEPQSNKKVIIIAVVVAVVLLVIMVLVLVLCYVMRSRYKRKLKAAHAVAFDTHTLGFDIDQTDMPQSVNNIPGTTKLSTSLADADDKMSVTSLLYPYKQEMVHEPYCTMTLSTSQQAAWPKDSPLNNFDWGKANGGFDSESHRSSHSHDDNAIDPLNGAETQSCSSAGSNDWRLDLRGNNLDCSPPPAITDEVTQSEQNEHNNQLNYESKFVDSHSDHSSSSSTTKEGHFNRLIMSDSVYGKIYETTRTPNGLETTEV